MHERVRDLLPRKSTCLEYVIFLKRERAEAVVLYPAGSCCYLLFPWQSGSFRPMESRCYLLYYKIPKSKVQGKHGVALAFTLFHTLSRNFQVSLGLKPRAASSPRLPEDTLAPDPRPHSPGPLILHFWIVITSEMGGSILLRTDGQPGTGSICSCVYGLIGWQPLSCCCLFPWPIQHSLHVPTFPFILTPKLCKKAPFEWKYLSPILCYWSTNYKQFHKWQPFTPLVNI